MRLAARNGEAQFDLMFKPKMKETTGYRIKLVGNADTVKRMIASLYIVNAKKQQQVVKVCICDDLPHVLNAVEAQQRAAPSHELLETGLTLQVGYGRSLTIAAKEAHDDDDLCVITPQKEVVIPNHAVWEPNAAFATDFHIHLQRPHEDAALQISITSQDEHGSDIPLNVPPRIRLAWHPKDVAGVQRIRRTWEETEERVANTLPRPPSAPSPGAQRKTSSLPRYQQPAYHGIEKMLQERAATSPRNLSHDSTSPRMHDYNQNDRVARYGGKPVAAQDKNWNVVTSPAAHEYNKAKEAAPDEDLPQWAKGYGDQFDYDDVVVV